MRSPPKFQTVGALTEAKHRVQRLCAPLFDRLLLPQTRFAVAQAGQKGDPDVDTVGNLANVELTKN
jgi:hypothetical protein